MDRVTTYAGDWSNHDRARAGRAIDFASMAAAGISGGWHKSSDGAWYYEDTWYGESAPRMRDAFEWYGAYHVLWGNRTLTDQLDFWEHVLDTGSAWWRDDPNFSLMFDCEPFGYNVAPTIDQVNEAVAEVRRRWARQAFGYCPPWVYGANLRRLAAPLVSSNYGSNPQTSFLAAYPGDESARWVAVPADASGPELVADILQYGSRTTQGTHDDCDADAHPGSLTDLLALIRGDDDVLTSQQEKQLASAGGAPALGGTSMGPPVPEKYRVKDDPALQPDSAGRYGNSEADLLQYLRVLVEDIHGCSTAGSVSLTSQQFDELKVTVTAAVTAHHDALTDTDEPVVAAGVEAGIRAFLGSLSLAPAKPTPPPPPPTP